MKKYICTVCGFVYDPEEGDPDGGIDPGTAFEDIPDDWMCPVCGVTKEDFEPGGVVGLSVARYEFRVLCFEFYINL